VLARPFCRRITEAGNADTPRQSTIDIRIDDNERLCVVQLRRWAQARIERQAPFGNIAGIDNLDRKDDLARDSFATQIPNSGFSCNAALQWLININKIFGRCREACHG
jgi:hypothetical protein